MRHVLRCELAGRALRRWVVVLEDGRVFLCGCSRMLTIEVVGFEGRIWEIFMIFL